MGYFFLDVSPRHEARHRRPGCTWLLFPGSASRQAVPGHGLDDAGNARIGLDLPPEVRAVAREVVAEPVTNRRLILDEAREGAGELLARVPRS